jgi:hypothetical protein
MSHPHPKMCNTNAPDGTATINIDDIYARIQRLEEVLSLLQELVPPEADIPHSSTPLPPPLPSHLLAQAWAAPQPSHTPMTTHAKAETGGQMSGIMAPGDCVIISWDRSWQWNTSTARMPKTEYEGSRGTVLCTR